MWRRGMESRKAHLYVVVVVVVFVNIAFNKHFVLSLHLLAVCSVQHSCEEKLVKLKLCQTVK